MWVSHGIDLQQLWVREIFNVYDFQLICEAFTLRARPKSYVSILVINHHRITASYVLVSADYYRRFGCRNIYDMHPTP